MPWSSSCGTVLPKSTSSVTGSYHSTFSTAGVSSPCSCRLFPKPQWPSLDLQLTESHCFRGGMAGVLTKCNKSRAISPEVMGNPSTKRLGWYLLVCETKSKYTGRVWSSLSVLAAVTDLALNRECACRDFRENHCSCFWPILWASRLKSLKNPPAMWETRVRSLVGKIPWRRAWQSTPVFLSGESPRTEEPGRLQSMGLQRVGHDWSTKHSAGKAHGGILSHQAASDEKKPKPPVFRQME